MLPCNGISSKTTISGSLMRWRVVHVSSLAKLSPILAQSVAALRQHMEENNSGLENVALEAFYHIIQTITGSSVTINLTIKYII
jgi:hypothetical protein